MTSQPIDIFLSVGQRGSPNVIPNVGALAVANHILRTERNRDEVDVYSTNEFMDSASIPEYNYAVSLGRDPSEVQNLDDSLYQYLLYYYMSNLNRPEQIRIIPRIDPRYLGGLSSTDPAVVDEILRSRTYDFRNQLNNAVQSVRDLKLRVNYAPIIAQLLKDYPLSLNIASYINETIMKSQLRYSERQSKRRKTIRLDNLNISGPRVPEIFYSNIDEVPLNEILFELVEAAHVRGSGYIYQTTFADSIPMMAKISDQSNMHTIYEYQVGSHLNRVYEDCPFILYSYGLINSFIMAESLQGYMPVIDNDSDYWIGQSTSTPTAIYLSQWLEDGISLREFIAQGLSGYRLDEDDEPIAQSRAETFKSIMIAVLSSLQYLYGELGFVHNNLTFDNIVIRRLPEPVRIPLPGRAEEYFNSNCVPIIVNLSNTSLLGGSRGPEDPLISMSDRELGITSDVRVLTETKNITDYEKLLTSVLQFHETFDSWKSDDSIVNDLISFHVRALTDKSIDPVDDATYFLLLKESLLKVIHTPGLPFRSLPFQWNNYNVSEAVDSLISKWILDDDTGEYTSTIQNNINIDELIFTQIDRGMIVTTTYPGMLLNLKLSSNIKKYRTKGVDESLSRLLIRLVNAYNDQLAFLRRVDPTNRERFNMAYVQTAYREQINNLIRETIISEGRYWTSTSQVVEIDKTAPRLIMVNPVVDTSMDIEEIVEELFESKE